MAVETEKNTAVYDLTQLITKLWRENVLTEEQAQSLGELVMKATSKPPVDHVEIEPMRVPAGFRAALDLPIQLMSSFLHHAEVLKPGEQWTISMGSDCGYRGRLILQLDDVGTCADEEPSAPPAGPDEIVH